MLRFLCVVVLVLFWLGLTSITGGCSASLANRPVEEARDTCQGHGGLRWFRLTGVQSFEGQCVDGLRIHRAPQL